MCVCVCVCVCVCPCVGERERDNFLIFLTLKRRIPFKTQITRVFKMVSIGVNFLKFFCLFFSLAQVSAAALKSDDVFEVNENVAKHQAFVIIESLRKFVMFILK